MGAASTTVPPDSWSVPHSGQNRPPSVNSKPQRTHRMEAPSVSSNRNPLRYAFYATVGNETRYAPRRKPSNGSQPLKMEGVMHFKKEKGNAHDMSTMQQADHSRGEILRLMRFAAPPVERVGVAKPTAG